MTTTEKATRTEHDLLWVCEVPAGAYYGVHEVVANRALELLGRERWQCDDLHPIAHVNSSQCTNDAYPTL
jgi:aspartate ammonia-lyase